MKNEFYSRSNQATVWFTSFLFWLISKPEQVLNGIHNCWVVFYATLTNENHRRDELSEIIEDAAFQYNWVLATAAFCISAVTLHISLLAFKPAIVQFAYASESEWVLLPIATVIVVMMMSGFLTACGLMVWRFTPIAGYIVSGFAGGAGVMLLVYACASVWAIQASWGQIYICLFVFSLSTTLSIGAIESIRLSVVKTARMEVLERKKARIQARQKFKDVKP